MTSRQTPRTIVAQMSLVLIACLSLLLVILVLFEYFENDTALETAAGPITLQRVSRLLPVLNSMDPVSADSYVRRVSHCHDGFALSDSPYRVRRVNAETSRLASDLSAALDIPGERVRAGYTVFTREDFAYRDCTAEAMSFPFEGITISVRLNSGDWLNAEVHPHEWHLTPSTIDWLLRSILAFVLVGAVALYFVRRVSKPLATLADSASAFAADLKPSPLAESGPEEVRRTIQAFNVMQRQVVDELKRRNATHAAISHDIRSPLTAMRLKAEMIEDRELRLDFVRSIDRLESVTASALDYLRGEARNEPKRTVDLGDLVESECEDVRDARGRVTFDRPSNVAFACRPNALARAVRNLITNAVKHAGSAHVSLVRSKTALEISIEDHGPGIPTEQIARLLEPFEQLATPYDANSSGAGLGLAITRTLVAGHDGELLLRANKPTGLIATLHLPLAG